MNVNQRWTIDTWEGCNIFLKKHGVEYDGHVSLYRNVVNLTPVEGYRINGPSGRETIFLFPAKFGKVDIFTCHKISSLSPFLYWSVPVSFFFTFVFVFPSFFYLFFCRMKQSTSYWKMPFPLSVPLSVVWIANVEETKVMNKSRSASKQTNLWCKVLPDSERCLHESLLLCLSHEPAMNAHIFLYMQNSYGIHTWQKKTLLDPIVMEKMFIYQIRMLSIWTIDRSRCSGSSVALDCNGKWEMRTILFLFLN